MRWADLGPTPGRHRSASTRRPTRGLSAMEICRQKGSLSPGGRLSPEPSPENRFLRPGLDLVDRIVQRGRDQVLQHLPVLFHQRRIDAHRAHVVPAGHG